MELAVSNIAWTNKEEGEIADTLRTLGVRQVEIAPTKYWEDPTSVSLREAREYTDWWSRRGIGVVAFQSILFARPDLKLFESSEIRRETQEYMEKFIQLAGAMGAERMVFGSPKNRQIGELDVERANDIAENFFSKLGDVAVKNDVILCIEPNAPQYNCDFITTATEGAELVRAIDSDGIGLHLDTACMSLAGDVIPQSIADNTDVLKHFHMSAPMLDAVRDRDDVNYSGSIETLEAIKYKGSVSIEMRSDDEGKNRARVEEAVRFVQSLYG